MFRQFSSSTPRNLRTTRVDENLIVVVITMKTPVPKNPLEQKNLKSGSVKKHR